MREEGGHDAREIVLEVRDLTTRFGSQVVHEGVSFDVCRGEILAIVGGSGSGKTTLLREILQLLTPTAGTIRLFGVDLADAGASTLRALKRRLGVLFQRGALFGSLTVLENVGLPMREHTTLASPLVDEISCLKLGLVGLPPDAAAKTPSQLSGGMVKRAGLARALSLDPELLLLDEPTSGLDPVGARALDDLILGLKRSLDLTVILVTHDLDSIRSLADRVAMLGDGKLLALGTLTEVESSREPAVREYFEAGRARLHTSSMGPADGELEKT